jgi:hypothetical protein
VVDASFKAAFGKRDLFLITLDALRYDVAEEALASGRAPNLTTLIPKGFEARHTPATFTYAAHHAFFAGFFPTPPPPGRYKRPIAMRFAGSRSIGSETLVLDAPCLVSACRQAGHHTICVGGTEFFNPEAPLGTTLPRLFDEAHWSREMGVTSPRASALQLALAAKRLGEIPSTQRVFLFINAAATHPPTRIYVRGARTESPSTQRAALEDLDSHLPVLIDAMRARGGAVGIICSDHGTCFGEDGYEGHRVAHDKVWTVPYAEVTIDPAYTDLERSA